MTYESWSLVAGISTLTLAAAFVTLTVFCVRGIARWVAREVRRARHVTDTATLDRVATGACECEDGNCLWCVLENGATR